MDEYMRGDLISPKGAIINRVHFQGRFYSDVTLMLNVECYMGIVLTQFLWTLL